jgi:hypothetical protein
MQAIYPKLFNYKYAIISLKEKNLKKEMEKNY